MTEVRKWTTLDGDVTQTSMKSNTETKGKVAITSAYYDTAVTAAAHDELFSIVGTT